MPPVLECVAATPDDERINRAKIYAVTSLRCLYNSFSLKKIPYIEVRRVMLMLYAITLSTQGCYHYNCYHETKRSLPNYCFGVIIHSAFFYRKSFTYHFRFAIAQKTCY